MEISAQSGICPVNNSLLFYYFYWHVIIKGRSWKSHYLHRPKGQEESQPAPAGWTCRVEPRWALPS